jgi:hypothetical protein
MTPDGSTRAAFIESRVGGDGSDDKVTGYLYAETAMPPSPASAHC